MSILQYPDSFKVPELQVWNNAAFDNGGESEDTGAAVKASWSNLESGSMNRSIDSDGSKENLSPAWLKSPVSFKSNASIVKPLSSKNVNATAKEPASAAAKLKRDEKKIDMEIEEVEKEITRLSSKLESLRLEKAECNARSVAMKGRIVAAKFMDQKQSAKKVEDPLFSKPKLSNRRGMSLGPAEIFSASKSRQLTKQEIATPIQSIQNRRKSCFFKLQDIDEGKVTRERGKSLSLSPKSRKTVSKIQVPKPAATTVGSKRAVKKDDAVLAAVQPKRLFKDGEKSVTAKKPLKPGRIVASRYNQIPNDARKRSLPENDKEEGNNRHEKKRVSNERVLDSCKNQKSESRVKKKWEIPSEVVVFKGSMVEEQSSSSSSTPQSVIKINNVLPLPMIRTVRFPAESPRDSGPAKRVAELMGKRSYFCVDEEEEEAEDSVCQVLSFAEED